MWDPCADAWLSGFADGEGSFVIAEGGAKGRRLLQPRFTLHLRADDAPILRALRDALGGTTRLYRYSGYDRFVWVVASKADLLRLVGYFDRFSLRAKKARDYAIWREAVDLYCYGPGTRAVQPALQVLMRALNDGRRYERDATVTSLRAVS